MKPFDTEKLVAGLAVLADPGRRKAMSKAARAMLPVNGAAVAADSIVEWVAHGRKNAASTG